MPNDSLSENAPLSERHPESALVSWFEANRASSKTAKRFFDLADKGWTVPSTDSEASE